VEELAKKRKIEEAKIREENKTKPQQEVDKLVQDHRKSFIDKATADRFPRTENMSPKALASLQKQLMELEVCDLLSGQVDRHQLNYLIDVQGDEVTVKGIDNDFAFGTKNNGGIPMNCGQHNIPNMPVLMDKGMAEKILSLNFEKDCAPKYEGLLTPQEVNAAKDRFVALQNHVTKLTNSGMLVDDWENWKKDGKSVTEILGEEKDVHGNTVKKDESLAGRTLKAMEEVTQLREDFEAALVRDFDDDSED
jgi:hypothetical protein